MFQSQSKLEKVYEKLKPFIPTQNLQISPCGSDEETVGYRCKCSFQFIYDDEDRLCYAIRQQRRTISIQEFPVANERIRIVMKSFLDVLRDSSTSCAVTRHLSSVSFASSWSNDGDCVVTCHYDGPIEEPRVWEAQARTICQTIRFSQLFGRSRGCVLAAFPSEAVLRDQLVIKQMEGGEWMVTLDEPEAFEPGNMVVYEKPESAFFHPNVRAMLKALKWQLDRASFIRQDLVHRKARLVELYCGCGAHTVALAKSDMFESIVAIELDQRLVDKCQRNIELNECQALVEVLSIDAGIWAKSNGGASFDVMLVDPPRQGLAEEVCRLAIDTRACEHLLYISCGYEALVRDLQILRSAFDVIDCTVIDLFPTMEGAESLVHLRRRKV